MRPLLTLLVCLAACVRSPALTVVHVSSRGDDSLSGLARSRSADGRSGPLRSLRAALDLRTRLSDPEVRIVLAEGRHELSDTLRVLPEHSGSGSAPLVIEAAAGRPVVVSGGKILRGWKASDATPHLWTCDVPEIAARRWYFRQLVVGGQRWRRATSPNRGFFQATRRLGAGPPVELRFKAGDLKAAHAGSDAELVILMKWTDLHLPPTSVDEAAGVAILPGGPLAPWMDEPDARYRIENAPDALDEPGEWLVERRTGRVSLLGSPGFDPERETVVAPRMDCLVRFEGRPDRTVHHVVFRGIRFEDAGHEIPAVGRVSPQAAVESRGAIRAEHAEDCGIEDCTVRNCGGYGVDLGDGCRRWRIVGNELTQLGAGGIRLGQPDSRDAVGASPKANHSHVVTDNHLHALGRIFAPACGILVFQSGTNRIAHNHIHDLYYTGISVGWTWGYRGSPCRANLIEHNHVHDIGQGLLSDMGGIYTLGPQPGTVVRNNLFHDVSSYRYGGWGLYTDEGSTGIVLEDNVVYRCEDAGFHQHYGRDNVVRNNLLVANRNHSVMRTRPEPHLSFRFSGNVVVGDAAKLLGSDWSGTVTNFLCSSNLWWDPAVGSDTGRYRFAGGSFEEWQARGQDAGSRIADPLLIDPGRPEKGLRPGSPAFATGFRAIDMERVGPRPKDRRD